MIRLKESGERGSYLTVEMTPFDALSLLEGLSIAILRCEDVKKENPDNWEILGREYKLKDARANYSEIEKVLADREEILRGMGKDDGR
jgi:hypothetical protein